MAFTSTNRLIGSGPLSAARGMAAVFAIVGFHLALCFAAVWYLQTHFYLSKRVVLLHMLILVSGVGVFGAGLGYSLGRQWIRNTKSSRIALAVIATTAVGSLAALYSADVAANFFWGSNFNYQVAAQYASMLVPNRPPLFVSGWLHITAAIAAAFLFLIYRAGANYVLNSLEQSAAQVRAARHRRLAVAVACGLTIAYATGVGMLARGMRLSGLLYREPIVGFFSRSDSLFAFNQYAMSAALTEKEHEVRARYPRHQSFERKNVVLIVVDSLRADRMGVYGYERATTPFLSRLRDSGRLHSVQLALSTCAESTCGILSMLTSKALTNRVEDSFSLDMLLADQGYLVYRILSGNHNWMGLKQAYSQEQVFYFDSSNSQRFGLNDDSVLFEALDQIGDFQGTPAFFHFHLMSAHFLGIKHDTYRKFEPAETRRSYGWILNGDDKRMFRNAYDNGVLEADATIERVFAELQRKGYLANSVVVIVADHGEGLGERGTGRASLGHLHTLYQESIRVPLLFYDEANAPYRNLTFATQIDIAPTIVDRLGLPIPPSWEGRSLLDPSIKLYSIHETSPWTRCYAVVHPVNGAVYKYLRCGEGSSEELYELMSDPAESHNLIATNASVAADLRERLRASLTTPLSPD